MKKLKYMVIVLNMVLLLGYFNWSVAAKEDTLKNGRLVLLELAPVDPRSLMQGDYMRLRYAINTDMNLIQGIAKRGYCIVKIDSGKAKRVRFQPGMLPLRRGEVAIKYFSDGDRYFSNIHIGAESYFFEEGKGKRYDTAKYGGLMVDNDGNSILVGLYDDRLKKID
jgi:uncharacterized membrane-anchored protein